MSARSLVGQLALVQQALAAILILLFAGSTLWISASALKRQESTFLLDEATQVAASVALERREEGDLSRAARAALSENAPVGIRIRVLDARGGEIGATPAGKSPGGVWRETRVAVPGGGWVVASAPVEQRLRAVRTLAVAIAVTAIPLFAAVTLLSRVVARRALRRLSRIASQAERASAAPPVSRFRTDSDPTEIAALADAFDRLFERIQEALATERHFTRDAAHELRTPLTVLYGELECALQDSSLPSSVREGLDRALLQGLAMTDLVEALLLLRDSDRDPRARAEMSQPVNLSDLVRDAECEFRESAIGRGRDLRVAAEDEVLIAGHSTLLSAAIRNLLSNALKFTSPGQPVSVRVFNGSGRGTVVVDDAGPGIALDDRERVFETFYRGSEARAAHDGFGLGLPILRRVARAHRGDVIVSSSPLGGARFALFIPSWGERPEPEMDGQRVDGPGATGLLSARPWRAGDGRTTDSR